MMRMPSSLPLSKGKKSGMKSSAYRKMSAANRKRAVEVSEVCEDIKVVQQLNTRLPVKSLISEGATFTSVLGGLRDHQFVHFASHGTLEASKPFDTRFKLYANEHLTLLNIV